MTEEKMVCMPVVEFKKLIEDAEREAGRQAACEVLDKLGLNYEGAADDIASFKRFASAWRLAKSSFWKGVWEKLGIFGTGLFLAYLIAKSGITVGIGG